MLCITRIFYLYLTLRSILTHNRREPLFLKKAYCTAKFSKQKLGYSYISHADTRYVDYVLKNNTCGFLILRILKSRTWIVLKFPKNSYISSHIQFSYHVATSDELRNYLTDYVCFSQAFAHYHCPNVWL